MSAVIDFYMGLKADGCKHLLLDTWEWSLDRLEEEHDYIQWWFPLEEPSAYNKDAPILTEEDIEAFKGNTELTSRALNSVHTYMRFLFFRKHIWATGPDHNHLRITRMLKFVNRIFANSMLPEMLLAQINVMVASVDGHDKINKTTIRFWVEAVYGPEE